MKASESSERYVGKVRECCNYAVRSAKNFSGSDANSSRQPGGSGEAALRENLKKDLASFTDEVEEVPVRVRQKAPTAVHRWTLYLMLITAVLAILGSFLHGAAGVILFSSATLFALLTLFASFGIFGKNAGNVSSADLYAVRKPLKATEHRIILQANLDAPFQTKRSTGAIALQKFFAVCGSVLYLVFSVLCMLAAAISLALPVWFHFLAFPLLLFLIAPLVLSRSVSTKSSFPGVSDNLSGCYAAAGAARYLSEEGVRLNNTEIDILLTTGKSNQQEGTRTFLKKYESSLKEVDTTVLCLDSLYDLDSLNTTATGRKLNRALAEAVENAGVMLADHTPKYHTTEADLFRKSGVPAVLLTSLPDEAPEFYRSEEDDTSRLDVRSTEAAIKIALEIAFLKDDPESDF